MEASRQARLDTIILAAAARPPEQRAAFLDEACAGDPALRLEAQARLGLPHQGDAPSGPVTAEPTTAPVARGARRPPPTAVGPYRILRTLGAGGMGVVYAAEDTRLGRTVALKVMQGAAGDETRWRLVREARLAAGVSHPLVCQIFELGEHDGEPFIAMEMLAGSPLSARLRSGPLPVPEALGLARAIAEALRVLHQHGIVHRDLKPSNIFVTPTGLKVLDFGLARPLDMADATTEALTRAGVVMGSPPYSAPEQLTGGEIDARADIFSAGAILFEMLAGAPPFGGKTVAALVHAVLFETPPVLTGSPAIRALDRIVHRALAKAPAERYPSAEALLADLAAVPLAAGGGDTAQAQAIQRLAVLPFRLLNPDPETEYLSVSFADALTSVLGGFESLVVRSTLASARFAKVPIDLKAVAAELAVDVVLSGTILRRGGRLRISAELLSVPSGDVWWTHSTEVPSAEVFDVHEQIAQHVVRSLPLSAADQRRLAPARPADAKAFDLYLRGMQLRMESSSWLQAHSFFTRSLELDPSFAPAWAERGRLDRIIGKYEGSSRHVDARQAFDRALALDPESGAAHGYLAQLDVDHGRLEDALVRLLDRAGQQRAEPLIYAALVHACRYAGLLDASLAADARARRLDPTVTTSVLHTLYMRGDYERALDAAHRTSDPLEARVLAAMGRRADAMAAAEREEARFAAVPLLRSFSTGLRAALAGDAAEAIGVLARFDTEGFTDGEGRFYLAEIYAMLDLPDRARAMLERAAAAGFVCLRAFEESPSLQPLRSQSWWPALTAGVRARHDALGILFARYRGAEIVV